ncbi:MAG: hypothetical protein IKP69_11070 [Oscillospiraceae bacterium]|nr:hypothetical protein [Oscillospiraceae bacterium]
MNISKNIQWITDNSAQWKFYTNKSYRAKIQRADSQQVYNVADKPGVVYNCLEDAYEKVGNTGYVITGIAGEMWPIGENAVKKYNVNPDNITAEAMEVDTVELDTVYAAIRIPADTRFTLEVNYGEKAVLQGNRSDIEHGEGDYVLVTAKLTDGVYLPDFDDSGRIINGVIFDKLYKLYLPYVR